MSYTPTDPLIRFYEKVNLYGPMPDQDDPLVTVTSQCCEWMAYVDSEGYGRFRIDSGRMALAHRFIYEMLFGEIPDRMTIDHLCRNRACVNPLHMEVVTIQENMARGNTPSSPALRTGRCQRDHDEWSVHIRKSNGRPFRVCLACARDRRRERKLVAA